MVDDLPGRLHVPAAYATDPNTPRPLILFLHGGGETGYDNLLQINGNINNLLTAAKARGAFLYAPQTSFDWTYSGLIPFVLQMIDRAIVERNVDPNRIYITGLSMGGAGVWDFLNAAPERFAAAVPICAVYPTTGFVPANVVNEPIWAFHARNDTTVPPSFSRTVIDILLDAGRQPQPNYPALTDTTTQFQFDDTKLDLHYREYNNGGHNIWPRVYNTVAMYDWLFSHRSVPEPGSMALALVGAAISAVSRAGSRRRLANSSAKR